MRVNEVYEGDCLEVMEQLPDNCIDAIITDPPYELTNRTPDVKRCVDCKRILGSRDGSPSSCPRCGGVLSRQRSDQLRGFMGKEWDGSGITFDPTVWREALRIAKPGAYLLAFGGTRTYHRLACAIEDAGWEIRDCVTYLNDGNQAEAAFMASLNDEQLAAYLELYYPSEQIAWVYGQGMGLGHDVSKGIDKSKGAEREVIGYDEYKLRRYQNGRGQYATGSYKIHLNGENRTTDGRDANKIRERQTPEHLAQITAPATPLAAKFSGYRSRLKPAFEPIVVAMKPIDTNYAHNAERWGLAGLNIDGCRVGTNGESLGRVSPGIKSISRQNFIQGARPEIYYQDHQPRYIDNSKGLGRYPANLTHSGESGVMAEFAKAGVRVSGEIKPHHRQNVEPGSNGKTLGKCWNSKYKTSLNQKSSGTPARYFATCPPDDLPRFIYQAKAGPKERGAANNHPTVKPLSLIRELVKLCKPPDGGVILDPFAGSGTTALACISEGADYILIEKEPEYCEIIRRRIAEYTGQEIAPKEIEINEQEKVRQMSLW